MATKRDFGAGSVSIERVSIQSVSTQSMLRAIAFDLWETLITEHYDSARVAEQLRLEGMQAVLVKRGLTSSSERMEHAYRWLWNRCQELYWSREEDVPCRRQVEHFLEGLGI